MNSRRRRKMTWSTAEPGVVALRSLCLLLCLTSLGCYQRQEFKTAKVTPEALAQQFGDKPAALQPYGQRLLAEGQRNAVLNQMRLGVRAMEIGAWNDAAEAFDAALGQIESCYADNENARKARSLYYEEGMKDFKGEPYERCMAYYYRGLLYLQQRDFGNARACFKSGILQDAFAEEEQNRCDFATLIFLDGWAAQQTGDAAAAQELFQEAKRYRPDFPLPSPQDNVLLVAETGTAPRKVADGVGHAELKYRRGRAFTEKHAQATVNGRSVDLFPMDDVLWQASSRGGRAVDKILEGKVQYRQTNEQIGTVLTEVSSTAMISAPLWGRHAGAVQGVSAAIELLGILPLAAAASAKTHADTRYWDNLPDGIHIATMAVPPGRTTVGVDFKDESGAVVANLRKERTLEVPPSGPTVVWVRAREGYPQEQN